MITTRCQYGLLAPFLFFVNKLNDYHLINSRNYKPKLVLWCYSNKNMFGFIKRKSEKEKLQDTYSKLLSDAHKLSRTNRKLADAKLAEAEEILKRIEQMKPD